MRVSIVREVPAAPVRGKRCPGRAGRRRMLLLIRPQACARRRGGPVCGIVGFLDKRGGQARPAGRTLLAMLQALSCRGPDSAGVAVFQTQPEWHARVSAPPGTSSERAIAAL